jgi:hypothetical protein
LTLSKFRNTFFCFQGLQFDNEAAAGYMFALDNTSNSHWNRLKNAKVGDVVFHCCDQQIRAISEIQREAYIGKRPLWHFCANGKPDKKGLRVDTKYVRLEVPIIISQFKNEIKKLQGDSKDKGFPFDKNGEGNQGYFYNLKKELADLFFNEIIVRNPKLSKSQEVQVLMQDVKKGPPKAMKCCPICNLNLIEAEKDCCDICVNDMLLVNHKTINSKGKKNPLFQEEFTFTNERKSYKGKTGYKAFNSKGDNIGIVYATDDERTPAFGHCELCIYPEHHNQYGEWHRIKSYGERIKWTTLCTFLEHNREYKVFID